MTYCGRPPPSFGLRKTREDQEEQLRRPEAGLGRRARRRRRAHSPRRRPARTLRLRQPDLVTQAWAARQRTELGLGVPDPSPSPPRSELSCSRRFPIPPGRRDSRRGRFTTSHATAAEAAAVTQNARIRPARRHNSSSGPKNSSGLELGGHGQRPSSTREAARRGRAARRPHCRAWPAHRDQIQLMKDDRIKAGASATPSAIHRRDRPAR